MFTILQLIAVFKLLRGFPLVSAKLKLLFFLVSVKVLRYFKFLLILESRLPARKL